ncbi:WD40-repeat-containing domain protein [Cubamyces menziesii]|nr:WD40-repeat-containing domain protein [Cubamyces menziesii]
MPDSFFATSKNRKRKRSTTRDDGPSTSKKAARAVKGKGGKGRKPEGATKKKGTADEELSDATQDDDERDGIDEMDLRAPDVDPNAYESGEEDEDETPAEKRLRLAKMYLESVKQGLSLAEGEFDAAEIDRELISARLKQDVLEHSGKIHLFVADIFDLSHTPSLRTKRGHRFSVTAAVASHDARWLYTSGKEGSIIKWDLHTGRQVHTFHKCRVDKGKGKSRETGDLSGHTDEIWALAISPDGKYLASGGKDRRVGVWDAEKNEWVKGFGGHRDCISALAFRKAQPSLQTPTQLYSGSYDRTLKLFDLSTMGYVETLFGHQDPVLSIDTLRAETAVSAGGRDKTVRFWKVPEETQLVFRGGGGSKWYDDLDGMEEDNAEGRPKGKDTSKSERFIEGSIECVAMIDETTFVSGGDSGSISLWSTQKKKPIFTQAVAHGMDISHEDTEDVAIVRKPRWVTALASLRYSDLFASGSWDGEIRLWKVDQKLKSFSPIGTIPALGVVNSLQFLTPPKDFASAASWASRTSSADASEAPVQTTGKQAKAGSAPVLLVAGVGQETRFGRWIQRKGEGHVNGALVFALHPRT